MNIYSDNGRIYEKLKRFSISIDFQKIAFYTFRLKTK